MSEPGYDIVQLEKLLLGDWAALREDECRAIIHDLKVLRELRELAKMVRSTIQYDRCLPDSGHGDQEGYLLEAIDDAERRAGASE